MPCVAAVWVPKQQTAEAGMGLVEAQDNAEGTFEVFLRPWSTANCGHRSTKVDQSMGRSLLTVLKSFLRPTLREPVRWRLEDTKYLLPPVLLFDHHSKYYPNWLADCRVLRVVELMVRLDIMKITLLIQPNLHYFDRTVVGNTYVMKWTQPLWLGMKRRLYIKQNGTLNRLHF